MVYFELLIIVATAIGIQLPWMVLIAALTLTGILSLVPIAPSGLGTRDAALLLFLTPYGITAEQAVSLALVMFASIIVSGIPGGIYWIKGLQQKPKKVH